MRPLSIALVLAVSISLPLLAGGSAKNAQPCMGEYSTFTPKGFVRNFSTVIPKGSKVIYFDGFNETTYTVSAGAAKIRIRAMYSKENDIADRIQEKKWEIRDTDPSVRTIIEGQPVTLKASIKGTLLVYQYKNAKKKSALIQRTLILSQGNFAYIMDCSAPVCDFYAYEQAFNIAIGGFLVTDQAFVPAEKPADADTVKKARIKVDQKELDSMGLKEEDRKNDTQPSDSNSRQEKPAQN